MDKLARGRELLPELVPPHETDRQLSDHGAARTQLSRFVFAVYVAFILIAGLNTLVRFV